MMKFTYESYRELLKLLTEHNYRFVDYKNWQGAERCVILRHDIDCDIDKAVNLSAVEKTEGVSSTYFVLLTSDFYNVFSRKSVDGLQRIVENGHTIGLHFDEVHYPEVLEDEEAIKEKIIQEAEILGRAIGNKIDIVSMHRPSKYVLKADLNIPGMINSYGKTYFKNFKYLSDSRRCWKKPVDKIIESEEYDKLHILTHAFWYNETEEDIHKSVSKFVNSGNRCRYQTMEANITDFAAIMTKDELK